MISIAVRIGCLHSGERDPQERAHPAQAQVAAGLDQRAVDPVQAREQDQDQVRDVAVDQAEDDRDVHGRRASRPGGEIRCREVSTLFT